MKDRLITTVNYVRNHKKILAYATVTTLVAVQQARHIGGLNKFLCEKNIFNEYYQI